MSKIYSNGPANIYVQIATASAELAGQQVELVYLTPEQIAEPAFQQKKQHLGFPILELESGEIIGESSAIAAHFARLGNGTYGANAFEAAKIDEWIAFAQHSILANAGPVVYAVLGHRVVPQDQFVAAVNKLKAQAKILNGYLKDRQYLVGDSVTVADVLVAGSLVLAFQTVFDGGFRKGMAALTSWFERCIAHPAFVNNFGHIKMTEKAMKAFDPSAKPAAAAAPKKDQPKKEAKAAEADDDLDLFGDDNEEDAAAAKAAAEAAKSQNKKKVKAPVIAQSLVLFEVKPADSETDLDVLAQRVLAIQGDGIYWKTEYKKEPVAYGIFKLIIGVTVEDEKVSVDGLQEQIEALDDMVQSVEILAFNKI